MASEGDEFKIEDVDRVVAFGKVLGYEYRVRVLAGLHEHGPASATMLRKKGVGNLVDIDYHDKKLVELGAAELAPSQSATQRFYQLTDFGREALRIAAVISRVPDPGDR